MTWLLTLVADIVRAVLHAFLPCRHRQMWQERRFGALHFVCDCGYAVPVIKRTPDEQQLLRRA